MGCIVYGKEKAGFTFNSTDTNFLSNVTITINDDFVYSGQVNIGQELQYSFLSPGKKTISASIEFDDGWGNAYTYETDIVVSVKTYNAPVIDFSWDPIAPTINDLIKFTPDYIDTRSDVTKEYYGKVIEIDFDVLDNGIIDGTVLPNNIFEYQFQTKYKNAQVRMIARYNDGFTVQQVDILNNIQMANIPPVASWSFVDNGGQCVPSYTWNSTSYDIDDVSVSVKWDLYIDNGTSFELITSANTNSFTWVFQEEGRYKLVLTADDGDGGKAVAEDIFNVKIDKCGKTIDELGQAFIIEWE